MGGLRVRLSQRLNPKNCGLSILNRLYRPDKATLFDENLALASPR
jgi:hypothetical protein